MNIDAWLWMAISVTYRPKSSKDLTEYNGELISACWSANLTTTLYEDSMRSVARSCAVRISVGEGDNSHDEKQQSVQ